MITIFDDYTANMKNADQQPDDETKIINEYLGCFQRKALILEAPWEDDVYTFRSVFPFFANLSNMISKEVQIGFRSIDSAQSLYSYIRYPGGSLWSQPQIYGTTCFLIETHANSKQGITLPQNNISRKEIIENFKGFGQFPNILIFGGCGLFGGSKGKEFGRTLLAESGTRGVFGYTCDELSWYHAGIIEFILLSKFYLFDGDPFKNLLTIYENVLYDYPLAASKEIGFTLFCD
jgi:hypothetical protein